MDIVLESISACSVRHKLLPRFYNLTKNEGATSLADECVLTHKAPFSVPLKNANQLYEKRKDKDERNDFTRVSLFPILAVAYMFVSRARGMTAREARSRIKLAKTDLFIVLFPKLSRKRMQKLGNVSRRKNVLEILKPLRFVCIPLAQCCMRK